MNTNIVGTIPVASGCVLEAVREAKGDDAASRIEKMKKADAIVAAAAALDGTRWVPSLLC